MKPRDTWPRLLGALIQGAVVGIALMWTLYKIITRMTGGWVFRYEGF
jgi:hypothetical protein